MHSNIYIHITLIHSNQIDNTQTTQEIYLFTANHAEIECFEQFIDRKLHIPCPWVLNSNGSELLESFRFEDESERRVRDLT